MVNADVLIVSGSLGSGKTTVMSEASDLLCAAGVDHAAIDLDALTVGHLLHAASLTRRNLAAIWHNYAAFGIRRVLLAGAIDTAARLDEVRDSIPDAHLVICFMVQILPNTTDLGRKFPTLVYQALEQ